jgi:hypothetical protein
MAEQATGPPRPATPTHGDDVIEISGMSDLTITVLSGKDQYGQRRLTRFKVEAKSLTTNSEYFTASLRFNNTNGHEKVELQDDDLGALHVWFIYMQAAKEREDAAEDEADYHAKRRRLDDSHQDRAIEEALFAKDIVKDTDIDRIWHIINAADKYL